MDYKDTVMGNKKLQLLGQQYEDDLPTYSLNHYLLLAQAEITWPIAKQSGMREVVEWIEEGRLGARVKPEEWQAFKEKRGL